MDYYFYLKSSYTFYKLVYSINSNLPPIAARKVEDIQLLITEVQLLAKIAGFDSTHISSKKLTRQNSISLATELCTRCMYW